MLYPVELQAQSLQVERFAGRGRGIRTPDFCVPNATLYQTELYPAKNTDHIRCAKLSNVRVTYRPVNPYTSTPNQLAFRPAKQSFALQHGSIRERTFPG